MVSSSSISGGGSTPKAVKEKEITTKNGDPGLKINFDNGSKTKAVAKPNGKVKLTTTDASGNKSKQTISGSEAANLGTGETTDTFKSDSNGQIGGSQSDTPLIGQGGGLFSTDTDSTQANNAGNVGNGNSVIDSLPDYGSAVKEGGGSEGSSFGQLSGASLANAQQETVSSVDELPKVVSKPQFENSPTSNAAGTFTVVEYKGQQYKLTAAHVANTSGAHDDPQGDAPVLIPLNGGNPIKLTIPKNIIAEATQGQQPTFMSGKTGRSETMSLSNGNETMQGTVSDPSMIESGNSGSPLVVERSGDLLVIGVLYGLIDDAAQNKAIITTE